MCVFNAVMECLEKCFRLKPSMKESPIIDLKPLPNHLCYAFLGEKETLLAIISSRMNIEQEVKLISILKKFKKAIG